MPALIVSTEWLQNHLDDSEILPVFARGVHGKPEAAREEFFVAHIPGSAFLNLDRDLAEITTPERGRHPLPSSDQFAKALAREKIGNRTHIIAYDDSNGSQAARLWWMLRWIGYDDVSVLDGGMAKWVAEQRPIESGAAKPREMLGSPIQINLHPEMSVDMETVSRAKELGLVLIDARSAERFRGENETIDSVAGRIPGAVSVPYTDNLTGNPKHLKSPEELREMFEQKKLTEGSKIVAYCGSGVTAAHDILALEIAGIHGAKLYAGSWSEWFHFHKGDI